MMGRSTIINQCLTVLACQLGMWQVWFAPCWHSPPPHNTLCQLGLLEANCSNKQQTLGQSHLQLQKPRADRKQMLQPSCKDARPAFQVVACLGATLHVPRHSSAPQQWRPPAPRMQQMEAWQLSIVSSPNMVSSSQLQVGHPP